MKSSLHLDFQQFPFQFLACRTGTSDNVLPRRLKIHSRKGFVEEFGWKSLLGPTCFGFIQEYDDGSQCTVVEQNFAAHCIF